jgi:hypothetical protein
MSISFLADHYVGFFGGFGHPPAGFFLANDFFMACCHDPLIFKISGFGPTLFFAIAINSY